MRMRFRALSFVGRPILAAAAFQAAKPARKPAAGTIARPTQTPVAAQAQGRLSEYGDGRQTRAELVRGA